MTTEQFRAKMTEDIKKFSTRKTFDAGDLGRVRRAAPLHARATSTTPTPTSSSPRSSPGSTPSTRHRRQRHLLHGHPAEHLRHDLRPPRRGRASRRREKGWIRIIVEKPFGHDLASAIELNKQLLAHWDEEQIYRIDHYLGKETVQNLLAFRFSNGMFEPLWNKNHIDHIQFSVAETVGVEGRGKYYDTSGVLRDMIQNHMFQMLAYLCMEPPAVVQARRDPQREGQAPRRRPGHDARGGRDAHRPRPVRPGQEGRRLARRRLPPGARRQPRVAGPRRSRPSSCSSTTGDGRACRSTSARARRSGSAGPRSSSSSRRPPR